MEHGSLQHWLVIAFTVVFAVALVVVVRNQPEGRLARRIAEVLAALLFLNAAIYAGYRITAGYWELRYDLPMDFCSWATIVTIVALLARSAAAAEVAYFWVMAGSLQGVISPDLQRAFPDPYFFMFFVGHSGLVIAVLFLALGMGLHPRRGSVWRTFGWTQVYFVSALAINYLLGSNYGYLAQKPANPSLLDHLGPWPYYWISLQVVMVVFVALAYLPFYWINRRPSTSGRDDASTPRENALGLESP